MVDIALEDKKVFIYDTTLREGCQKTGIAFSIEDKLRILERLIQDLHIPMIEAGWPGSNPKDIEFLKKIKKMDLDDTKIYQFSSTRRKNIHIENVLQVLEASNTKKDKLTRFIKIFLGTYDKTCEFFYHVYTEIADKLFAYKAIRINYIYRSFFLFR